METSSIPTTVSEVPAFSVQNTSRVRYHCIAEVRKLQNLSLGSVAKRLGLDIAEARRQEHPSTNLTIEQLYRWGAILDVPVAELLVDSDEMRVNPIEIRAKLVRIMKTVRSIMEQTQAESVHYYLAQTLYDQLVDIMPELKEVTPWPSVGQSREFKDYGQAVYRRFDPGVEKNLLE